MMKPKYRIKIQSDDSPESPREWDNLGTMVCSHNRYDLGDEQVRGTSEMDDYLMELLPNNKGAKFGERWEYELAMAGTGLVYGSPQYLREFDNVDLLFREKLMNELEKHYIIMPLYLYDHGGITISTSKFSCPWDSGLVGFIYVSKAKVRSDYGWKQISPKRDEQIRTYLKGEVEVYDHYLQGLVWGFVIEEGKLIEETFDPEDEDSWEWEEADGCWGFFGWVEDFADDMLANITPEFGITKEDIEEAFNDAIS